MFTLNLWFIFCKHMQFPLAFREFEGRCKKKENVSLTLRIIVSNKKYNKSTLYSHFNHNWQFFFMT